MADAARVVGTRLCRTQLCLWHLALPAPGSAAGRAATNQKPPEVRISDGRGVRGRHPALPYPALPAGTWLYWHPALPQSGPRPS